ncbi:hypothetical protein INT45_003473 [Circinella minor]|uniref:Uncharacterized protein n=1 Tax=Circinella minor TaxID=1195481 RepID=A0A8H7VQW9_9FUNG|nr:hypothetical protein INT45_003473 [Circinella minor]
MIFDARQAECGDNGNTDNICSPQKGEVWENSTWHQIIWNPSYPSYAANEFIDIYLYFVNNYQNIMVKNWTTIEPNIANFPIFIDDTFFPAYYQKEDGIHEAFIYIVGSDVNPDQEMKNRYSDYPAPILIQVIQKTDPITTKNDTTIINGSNQTDPNTTGVLQPWMIVIVAIACIAAVVACLIMIWAIRHVRRRKLVFNEKGHEGGGTSEPVTTTTTTTTTKDLHSSSITCSGNSSSTQFKNDKSYIIPPVIDGSIRSNSQLPSIMILDHHGNSYLPPDNMFLRPQSVASCSNISIPSTDTPPISSADALMIADTFRQHMRRPEWQQHQQQQIQIQKDDEESKRRQLSEELLKKELAAEGTLMKKVGKRAQLLSVFSDCEEEEVNGIVVVASDNSNNNHNHNTSFPPSHS